MTNEVIDTLTADGVANPEQLDRTLHDFDLDFSLKRKMAQKHVAPSEGTHGLDKVQLAAVMRKTTSMERRR
jgi:hypothetical protein